MMIIMMITMMMMSRMSGCAIVKQIHSTTNSEHESIRTAGLAEQKNKNKPFSSDTLVPSIRLHDVKKHQTQYEPISKANAQLKAARTRFNASPSISKADILAANLLTDRPLINSAGRDNYDTEGVFNKIKQDCLST
jgi:hypothetical protein